MASQRVRNQSRRFILGFDCTYPPARLSFATYILKTHTSFRQIIHSSQHINIVLSDSRTYIGSARTSYIYIKKHNGDATNQLHTPGSSMETSFSNFHPPRRLALYTDSCEGPTVAVSHISSLWYKNVHCPQGCLQRNQRKISLYLTERCKGSLLEWKKNNYMIYWEYVKCRAFEGRSQMEDFGRLSPVKFSHSRRSDNLPKPRENHCWTISISSPSANGLDNTQTPPRHRL